MTEFLRNLSLTRRNWRFDGERIVNADGLDPISAVAGEEDETYWVRCYAKAGLTVDEASLVSDASDDIRWSRDEAPVRKLLLEACGLS